MCITSSSVKQSLYRNMTREVEKIITRPIVSSKVERIKLDKAQIGINDKIHNDEKDYNEIEFSTSDTVQNDTHDHEIDLDEIEVSTSDKVQNDTQDHEIDIDENELSTSEQWERVNDLLLLITTILIFNATSLIIAFIQITWKAEGTVFNKALVLQSQKTIGMTIL